MHFSSAYSDAQITLESDVVIVLDEVGSPMVSISIKKFWLFTTRLSVARFISASIHVASMITCLLRYASYWARVVHVNLPG